MHVTGGWSLAGAIVTGLIIADLLYRYKGTTAILGKASSFGTSESRLLAGRS